MDKLYLLMTLLLKQNNKKTTTIKPRNVTVDGITTLLTTEFRNILAPRIARPFSNTTLESFEQSRNALEFPALSTPNNNTIKIIIMKVICGYISFSENKIKNIIIIIKTNK